MKRHSLAQKTLAGIVGALLIIGIGAWLVPMKFDAKPKPTQASSANFVELAPCYYGILGKDQVLLKIENNLHGMVRAKLNYQFFEKDSSWGSFTGSFNDTSLSGSFNYYAEGSLSTRAIRYVFNANSLSGDGFTLNPSTDCSLKIFGGERVYSPAIIENLKTSTFHDPETGFYAKTQFNIVGAKAKQNYRCYMEAVDETGKTLQYWIMEGNTFDPRPTTSYSGQTNLSPVQVPLVKSSTVSCTIANL